MSILAPAYNTFNTNEISFESTIFSIQYKAKRINNVSEELNCRNVNM